MKHKALFLDRDGVINVPALEGDYIVRRDFHLIPAIIPLIRFARAAGYLVVVVTNQRGVSTGKMTQADLDSVHAYMRELLTAEDADVDAVYACTHGFGECECRKPKAGMFFSAARDLDIDLGESIMVGDRETDMEAGRAAGCKLNILWK
jgi:D-glycero-D-manno-heptose 1,7-bisphosphate phosphatase